MADDKGPQPVESNTLSHTLIRADIQGLRGLAVLAVMVFHFNPVFLPGGYVGVDIFFVISGFLLTAILLRKKKKYGLSWRLITSFYAARIQRIAPAYFVMLFFVALVAAVFLAPADFELFRESFGSASFFWSNFFFAGYGGYFAPESYEQPLLHTWSLAIEMQFYLLIPVLILIPPRRLLPGILVTLLVLLTLAAEYRVEFLGQDGSTYYSLYARIPEFLAGSLAAVYLSSNSLGEHFGGMARVTGIVLIAVAALTQPTLGPFPGLTTLLPLLGAVLVILATPNQGGLIESPPLLKIGELSYSLYLWHWPILALLRYVTGEATLGAVATLVFLAITLLVSLASFYYVETPFRRMGKLGYGALGSVFLALATWLSPVAFGLVNLELSASPLPIQQQRYADPAYICHGRIVGDCVRGYRSSDDTVLVLGDSHGAMLNHFFEFMGVNSRFKASVITASNCVTIPKFDMSHLNSRSRQACERQISVAEQLISEETNIIVAGKWNWQLEKNDEFMDTLEKFIAEHSEKKIFLMPQVPKLKQNIARVRRLQALGLPFASSLDLDYQKANEKIRSLAEEYENAIYVPADELELFSSAPVFNDQLLYFDESHLTESGSLLYAEAAESTFRAYVVPHLRNVRTSLPTANP